MNVLRALRRLPDPVRAHGAWTYLALSVLAGVLVAVRDGPLPAFGAGLAFVGIFCLAGAGASRSRRSALRRSAAGLAVTGLGLLLTELHDAPPTWYVFAAAAVLPVALSGYCALSGGFLKPQALGFAVAALVLAAPAAACAGGAPPAMATALLAILLPFFAWRTARVTHLLRTQRGWTRHKLRRQGFQEAVMGVAWTLLGVGSLHAL